MRKPTALLLAGVITLGFSVAANADPSPAPVGPAPAPAATIIDDGPGGPAAPAPAPRGPAAELDDPLEHPADAWSDLVAAKRSGGWALALLAGLVMMLRVATRIPGGIGAWLDVGKRATAVAVGAAGAVAAYDALALGGRLSSVLFAIVGAALALMMPHAKKAEVV